MCLESIQKLNNDISKINFLKIENSQLFKLEEFKNKQETHCNYTNY